MRHRVIDRDSLPLDVGIHAVGMTWEEAWRTLQAVGRAGHPLPSAYYAKAAPVEGMLCSRCYGTMRRLRHAPPCGYETGPVFFCCLPCRRAVPAEAVRGAVPLPPFPDPEATRVLPDVLRQFGRGRCERCGSTRKRPRDHYCASCREIRKDESRERQRREREFRAQEAKEAPPARNRMLRRMLGPIDDSIPRRLRDGFRLLGGAWVDLRADR